MNSMENQLTLSARASKEMPRQQKEKTVQLLSGVFDKQDALDLVTQLLHVKIKFHESRIMQSENEEDIKMRENRIKDLQKDLFELRKYLGNSDAGITLQSIIHIN